MSWKSGHDPGSSGRTRVAVGFPDHGEPIGINKWRWCEQHGVHNAEDRGVGRDAQRNRDEDDDRKQRRSHERQEGVAHIAVLRPWSFVPGRESQSWARSSVRVARSTFSNDASVPIMSSIDLNNDEGLRTIDRGLTTKDPGRRRQGPATNQPPIAPSAQAAWRLTRASVSFSVFASGAEARRSPIAPRAHAACSRTDATSSPSAATSGSTAPRSPSAPRAHAAWCRPSRPCPSRAPPVRGPHVDRRWRRAPRLPARARTARCPSVRRSAPGRPCRRRVRQVPRRSLYGRPLHHREERSGKQRSGFAIAERAEPPRGVLARNPGRSLQRARKGLRMPRTSDGHEGRGRLLAGRRHIGRSRPSAPCPFAADVAVDRHIVTEQCDERRSVGGRIVAELPQVARRPCAGDSIRRTEDGHELSRCPRLRVDLRRTVRLAADAIARSRRLRQ